MRTRITSWFILLLVSLPSVSLSASLFHDEWDAEFKDATEAFLPAGTDYRLLVSQCYQESRLDPFAVSPVGARGLCQFMPGTWREVGASIGLSPDDVWIPAASIRAAGYYMGKLTRTWSAPRPQMDRHMISLASYNAGAGNLIKAQKLCGNKNLYKEIIPCLKDVTGEHSKETVTYVRNIVTKWYPALLFD